MVTVLEPGDLQHLNLWNSLVAIEVFTIHLRTARLFLFSALAEKQVTNNIFRSPMDCKGNSCVLPSAWSFHCKLSNYTLIHFFAILYCNIICSQILKKLAYPSISIILLSEIRTIPFAQGLWVAYLKDFTHSKHFSCFYVFY